ncbi:MAG: FAD:protein FMN transferase [Myxococcota bacterium]
MSGLKGLELDRRTLRLMAIAFVLLGSLSIHRLFFAPTPHPPDVLILSGHTMGTRYEIRIAGEGLDDALRRQVEAETTNRLRQIDEWMSNWNPDSEVARFNAYDGIGDFPVSVETAEVVALSIQLNVWSGGAFDIAVGPLVARWGFGHRAQIDAPPDRQELEKFRARLGPGMLRVGFDESGATAFIGKNDPAVEIDLSAIAKGYGVDHVADGLESLGRFDYLVEIGGEIRAAGNRPKGGAWRVAIERPQTEERRIQSIIELRDQAMATSGDYRIFYIEDGKQLSHTIDPRTGYPVEDGPASVTVLADSATEADAWATTLMVLGSRNGLALAEARGIAALTLVRNKDGTISEQRNALFPGGEAHFEIAP